MFYKWKWSWKQVQIFLKFCFILSEHTKYPKANADMQYITVVGDNEIVMNGWKDTLQTLLEWIEISIQPANDVNLPIAPDIQVHCKHEGAITDLYLLAFGY